MKIRVILIVAAWLAIAPVAQKMFAECSTKISSNAVKSDYPGGLHDGKCVAGFLRHYDSSCPGGAPLHLTQACQETLVQKQNTDTPYTSGLDADDKQVCFVGTTTYTPVFVNEASLGTCDNSSIVE